ETAYTWAGVWGIMRVTAGADVPTLDSMANNSGNWRITGSNTVNFALNNKFAPTIQIKNGTTVVQTATVNPTTGAWVFPSVPLVANTKYTLVSVNGSTNYGSRTFTPVVTPGR